MYQTGTHGSVGGRLANQSSASYPIKNKKVLVSHTTKTVLKKSNFYINKKLLTCLIVCRGCSQQKSCKPLKIKAYSGFSGVPDRSRTCDVPLRRNHNQINQRITKTPLMSWNALFSWTF